MGIVLSAQKKTQSATLYTLSLSDIFQLSDIFLSLLSSRAQHIQTRLALCFVTHSVLPGCIADLGEDGTGSGCASARATAAECVLTS